MNCFAWQLRNPFSGGLSSVVHFASPVSAHYAPQRHKQAKPSALETATAGTQGFRHHKPLWVWKTIWQLLSLG
eukprot:6473948-Amphidinium_carterae.1